MVQRWAVVTWAEEWVGRDAVVKRSVRIAQMVQVAKTDETEILGVGPGSLPGLRYSPCPHYVVVALTED